MRIKIYSHSDSRRISIWVPLFLVKSKLVHKLISKNDKSGKLHEVLSNTATKQMIYSQLKQNKGLKIVDIQSSNGDIVTITI